MRPASERPLAFSATALTIVLAACGGKFSGEGNVHGEPSKGVGAAPPSGGQSFGGVGSASSSGVGGPAVGSSSSGSSSGGSTSSGASPSASSGVGVAPPSGTTGTSSGTSGSQPMRGCGLGTSCIAGSDLAAPAASEGFQIVTPPGAFTVQPGEETFPNYCAVLPNSGEFDVGRMQSWMPPGSSHELFVYEGPTGNGCGAGASKWIFAASIPGTIVELKMPDGVGVPLAPGTQIVLSMHFINTTTSVEHPQVKLNLFGMSNLQYKAGAMVSFNVNIDIPSATPAGPGVQTVKGTCTAPAGASFFALGTHTNRHATVADVDLSSGGTTTNIVHTTDWQNPDVGVWLTPPFLPVGSGDQFTYSCAYANTGATPVTVGETEASNEMCMTVGYYFPEGSASCQ